LDLSYTLIVCVQSRWSAIDFPEGKHRRKASAPAAAPSIPLAQPAKKDQGPTETKEPKSQPSSPEKEKTGKGNTPAKSGKKSKSSPTKPPGAREMTAFFKKATGAEEKAHGPQANLKAGKVKHDSSPKKSALESFFAPKNKADEPNENHELRKVKEERKREDVLESPVEQTSLESSSSVESARQVKMEKMDDEALDDMDFENKSESTKRQRLRKGKRKRNGHEITHETEKAPSSEETAQTNGQRTIKKRKRAPSESKNEEEIPSRRSERKKRIKKESTKQASVSKKHKEQEEEDSEKENENHMNDDEQTLKASKTEKKQSAKLAEPGHSQRRKKKVRVESTYVDAKGFEGNSW